MISNRNIHWAIRVVREMVQDWQEPAVGRVARNRDAFRVLISCVLSLRTKDSVTHAAASRLFAHADTPQRLGSLPIDKIEELIYPVGFYRRKARNIKEICQALMGRHGGDVPRRLEDLLALPGVGRKTANLVMTVGHGLAGICVDTHVHRITNRWGYVRTTTTHQTEFALRKSLPRQYWIEFNDLLVKLGQNLCVPASPFCSRCRLAASCGRVGVNRWR